MGSCMGHCLPKNDASVRYRNNIFSDHENEFHFLVEENEVPNTQTNRKSFMSRLLSRKKKRCKNAKKPVLELVEELWSSPGDSSYSRLNKSKKLPRPGGREIPLQCLDVRALLTRNGDPMTSSTPVSSLDLEWEHEALPVSMEPSVSSWAIISENQPEASVSEASTTRHAAPSSASDWSRVSSADSLEWDPIQSPLHCSPPDIDPDTQQLLNEIERLTDQALRETGTGLTS